MPTSALAALLLAAGLLTGCGGGADCDALPALTAERDEARAAFAALVARQSAGEAVSDGDVEASHDRMHDLDTRTFELTTGCER